MDAIELSRREFRWLLAALIALPLLSFLGGFHLGAGQHNHEVNPTAAAPGNVVAAEIVESSPAPHEERVEPPISTVEVMEAPIEITAPTMPVETPTPEREEVAAIAEEPTPPPPPKPTLHIDEKDKLSLDQSSQHLFAIQVGNFTSADNANNYATLLKNKGLDAQVISDIAANRAPNFRVVTGLFADKELAKAAAQQQESKHNIKAYVAMLY